MTDHNHTFEGMTYPCHAVHGPEALEQWARPRSRHQDQIHELTEAIRLTAEYVGIDTLPPIEGWSWYDALKKYAPETLPAFEDLYNRYGSLPQKERELGLRPPLPETPASRHDIPVAPPLSKDDEEHEIQAAVDGY